jgi:2-amino-4-hydroxy-6-hydroxymethyldihydropteridine diphosphokinase
MPRWVTAFIALGANLGDRRAHIEEAILRLSSSFGIRNLRRASIYETEAVLPDVDAPAQPEYLNTVVSIETTLTPRELLACVKDIEVKLGRKVSARWAAREIDLDILLFGDLVVDEPGLTIPHPELPRRRFVLEPLVELAPILRHPERGVPLRELLDAVLRSGR